MRKIFLGILFAFLISVAITSVQQLEGRIGDIIIITIHNLGFVLGTGAATIINVFNVMADRDEKLRQTKMAIVRFLFYFVWAGVILMLFVHTAEFIGEQNIVHWAKFISVLAILAGVSYIWFYLFPQAKRLAPQAGENPSPELWRVQKQLKLLPPLVLFFWYMDFFLNSLWIPSWHF